MTPLDKILDKLPAYQKTAQNLREVLLANLVMFGEIPAPTFQEKQRISFLINRFKEAGLYNQWIDEKGNAIGRVEGREGEKNILVVAHADTVFGKKVDHTMQIGPAEVTGPSVADNSLGLATLATLPLLIEKTELSFKHNLILVGAIESLGRGNLKGLRSFLKYFNEPIKAGLVLEGAQLGRLSHASIGMLRGEISCKVPDTYDWSRFGETSAVLTINALINRINKIERPKRPRSSIVLGSIRAGSSFTTATKGSLRFEIRSESSDIVENINQRLQQIVKQVASQSGDNIELEIFAQRQPGGTGFMHPLVQNTEQIMESLDLDVKPGPSTSELSTFIDRNIPAITLGISKGSNVRNKNESVEIEPIFAGIAQILGALESIDQDFNDEP